MYRHRSEIDMQKPWQNIFFSLDFPHTLYISFSCFDRPSVRLYNQMWKVPFYSHVVQLLPSSDILYSEEQLQYLTITINYSLYLTLCNVYIYMWEDIYLMSPSLFFLKRSTELSHCLHKDYRFTPDDDFWRTVETLRNNCSLWLHWPK